MRGTKHMFTISMIAAVLLLVTTPVYAATVDGLFDTEVVVSAGAVPPLVPHDAVVQAVCDTLAVAPSDVSASSSHADDLCERVVSDQACEDAMTDATVVRSKTDGDDIQGVETALSAEDEVLAVELTPEINTDLGDAHDTAATSDTCENSDTHMSGDAAGARDTAEAGGVDNTSDAAEAKETPEIVATPDTDNMPTVSHNMYRLYNPNSGEHFYTADFEEARHLARIGWQWEGVGWVAPSEGDPVFRLYNSNVGEHHYTISLEERDTLISKGWLLEGVGWYSATVSSRRSVMRQYNPHAVTGTHNFTANIFESEALLQAGWNWEGVAWYALYDAPKAIKGFWLVTQAWGPLERYWVDSTATLARSRIVSASEGAGYDAYARPSGAVVRGLWDPGDGWAWFADNDGRLHTTQCNNESWLVTGDFTGGALQRYRVRPNEPTTHAIGIRVGLFNVDGTLFWGIPDTGYVLRGTHILLNGRYYLAESVVGGLSELTTGKYGWQNPAGYYQVSAYNVILPPYSSGIFVYASPSVISPDATREQCVEAFVSRAEQYLGTPYVWDYACAPGVGVDCAGLVLQCLYAVGISSSKYSPHDHFYTPGNDHYAIDMLNDPMFERVSFASRRRGDLVFYSGHVAIYLGNDTIIHATPDRVRYGSIYRWTPLAVSRVFL